MVNDNAPLRTVNKVFAVVTNHGRIITTDDLCYVDPDINYNSQELIYNIGYISNGYITQSKNKSAILQQFSQRDLEEGRVFFQNTGGSYGTAMVNVTDGLFRTVGFLEIQASRPYLRFVNSTAFTVPHGESTILRKHYFSIESNLDIPDRSVLIEIIEPPSHGAIVNEDSRHGNSFTLQDIMDGSVRYNHDGEL